jgi:hypothetical protein
MSWSGGCQCGAVRYRVDGELGRASLCHCRMCQKALGGPFGAFVSVQIADLVWTRGTRKRFQSSNTVQRGFCGDCGAPLTFEWSDTIIDLTIYSFDRAGKITPAVQLEVSAAAPWVGHVADLPVRDPATEPNMALHYAGMVSNQHPDHDT